jgi:hypothetical protein
LLISLPKWRKDLQLSKKSARWAIKLLYKEKKERVIRCMAFLAIIASAS